MARREMRWFGWGDPGHVSHGLPDGALELLRARVGLSDVPRPPFPASLQGAIPRTSPGSPSMATTSGSDWRSITTKS